MRPDLPQKQLCTANAAIKRPTGVSAVTIIRAFDTVV